MCDWPITEREDSQLPNEDFPSARAQILTSFTRIMIMLVKNALSGSTLISTIKQTTVELSTMVSAMQGRLEEAEARIVHLEETSEQLLNDKGNMDKHMEALWRDLWY